MLEPGGLFMRLMTILVCTGLVCTIFGQSAKFVQPKQDNVGVYKNQTRELYEKPLFSVDVNTSLRVVRSTKDHYKVVLDGKEGWIEKRLTAPIGKGAKTYLFDEAEVIGYLDNPTPVYIIDADDKERDPIKLDRSFAEALRENVDKETIERQTR